MANMYDVLLDLETIAPLSLSQPYGYKTDSGVIGKYVALAIAFWLVEWRVEWRVVIVFALFIVRLTLGSTKCRPCAARSRAKAHTRREKTFPSAAWIQTG